MAFPTSPTDGQTAIVNSVTYQYANSTNAWTRILSTANIITANTIAVNGNISAAGNVSGTYVAGTLTTVAQPNITSLGNLISLTVSNSSGTVNFSNTSNVTLGSVSNLHISGGTANYVLATNGSGSLSWSPQPSALSVVVDDFTGDGSTTVYTLSVTPGSINDTTVNYNGAILLRTSYSLSVANITFSSPPEDQAEIEVTVVGGAYSGSGGGTPGGSNTQVQFNDDTVFGGSSAFTFSKISNILSLTGNIVSGNLLTGGSISAAGNVTGSYIFGNGSQLTGLPATYGNANVVANLAALGSNPVSTTGNITSGNILTAGQVSATGNVTGSYIFGNGSQLTGIVSSYGNANVVANLAALGSNPVSTTGNITSGNILTAGLMSSTGNITGANLLINNDATITGNLVVNGNTTFINSNAVTTNDKSITLANNQSTAANVDGAGIDVGGTTIASWRFNNATTSWQSNIGLTPAANATLALGGTSNYWGAAYINSMNIATTSTIVGNVTGGNILTDGLISATSTITSAANISGGNLLTGGVISAGGRIAIASVTGNSVSTTGNIAGTYIFGNGALLTGVITSVANINNGTSNVTVVSSGGNVTVGIGGTGNVAVFATTGEYITGLLSATGNIRGGNILTAGYVSATGNGIFGNLTTSGTGGDLTGANIISGNTISGSSNVIGGNILTAGYVSAGGNITANTASFFIGNGSLLTGIAASYGNANVVANLANLGTNPVSTTGNITGGNLLTGGLISATGLLTIANANADIGTTTANSTYNLGTGATLIGLTKNINIGTAAVASSNTIITIGTALGTGNVTFPANTTVVIANIGGLALSAAGNITGGNLRTAGVISAGGQIAIASVTGNSVSTTGNIAGTFIFGNGALLTGVITSVANINNGTSNVTVVSSGGNITASVGGTSNVVVWATTGEYITGLLSASGNITAAGANADIGTTTANATFNIGTGVTPLGNTKNINIGTAGAASSNTIITIGTTLGTGNVTFPANTTVIVSNIGGLALSAVGNITGGNLRTAGVISATGNITSSANITGGNLLTGGVISAGGQIAIASVTGNSVSTTGNIAGTYIFGNGALLSGITASVSNINSGTSNATVVSANGNISISVGGTSNVAVFATTGEYVTGLISASGNVIAGNGIFTNIVNTASFTGAVVSVTGNITGGNITGIITSSRINPRTSSTASTASLTPDISAFDQYNLTALAANVTINAPTGTPVDGNKLMFRILDNGVTRTLTWNATYTVIGVTLPVATTANKMTYVGCIYNSANTRWDVLAVGTQT